MAKFSNENTAQIRSIVREETQDIREDVINLKTDVAELKSDVADLREVVHRQGILAEDTNKKIDIMLEILTATTKKSEKIDPLEDQMTELQSDHKVLKHTVTIHIADKDQHQR